MEGSFNFLYLLIDAPDGLRLQYQQRTDTVAVSFQPVEYALPVSYVVQAVTVEGKQDDRAEARLLYSTVCESAVVTPGMLVSALFDTRWSSCTGV